MVARVMRGVMAGLGTIGFICLLALVLDPHHTNGGLLAPLYLGAFAIGAIIDALVRVLYTDFINRHNKRKADETGNV